MIEASNLPDGISSEDYSEEPLIVRSTSPSPEFLRSVVRWFKDPIESYLGRPITGWNYLFVAVILLVLIVGVGYFIGDPFSTHGSAGPD